MSRNYKFNSPEGLYFVSLAVVGWLDVFTRNYFWLNTIKLFLVRTFTYFKKELLFLILHTNFFPHEKTYWYSRR